MQLSLPLLKKKVHSEVNKFVRERDKNKPCISCGRRIESGDCGHYVAQGSSGLLRYHPDNLALQCTSCNRFKHGNLINYRIGLVSRIGEDRVKWLEDHRHDTKKWRREELESILEGLKKGLNG